MQDRCSFNSRTLGRVRPWSDRPPWYYIRFQFTHPGKGATVARPISLVIIPVSIHAPWEGCDKTPNKEVMSAVVVSIHAPWEGCDLTLTIIITIMEQFQFTHPGKGATYRKNSTNRSSRVSIHAPWEGCDLRLVLSLVRRLQFQFTHPGKGATPYHEIRYSSERGFNSRTLGRVRQISLISVAVMKQVSIHAPWEGCDQCLSRGFWQMIGFQFTHPGKGATVLSSEVSQADKVSIHAPWEGCDSVLFLLLLRW